MKHFAYIIGIVTMLLSCSHIDESEQLIYVQQEAAQRVVLLEDFTGQRCVNCPKGTEIINQLQETYGNHLIAVGIYSGEFGKLPNGKLMPLTTTTGCEYFEHYVKGYGQPIGMVNRHAPQNYTEWTATVREEITKPSPVDLSLTATLHDENIMITIQEDAKGDNIEGKLQVWVLEDGITALQFMPDGSTNKNYIHHHVFRTSVNGTWGDPITLNAGEQKSQQLTQAIDGDWNKDNLSIVAFIYNDNGVLQAAKTKVTTN